MGIILSSATLTQAQPEPINLISPANNASNIPTPAKLLWHPASGVTTYNILVASNSSFTDTVIHTTTADTSYIASLTPYSYYYWKITGGSGGSPFAFSPSYKFYAVLETPVLLYPINNDTVFDPPAYMYWNTVPYTTYYNLQIATDSAFTNIVVTADSLSDTTYIPALDSTAVYYWHVQAWNSSGATAYCTKGEFFFHQPPPPPNRISPLNDSTGVGTSVTLLWDTVNSATTYTVELFKDSANWEILQLTRTDTTKYDTSLVVNVDSGYTYFWRVCTGDSLGTGQWNSPMYVFATTPVIAPTPPILLAPIDDATISPDTSASQDTVVLDWSIAPYASGYIMERAQDSIFTDSLQIDTTTNTFDTLTLYTNAVYYWKVSTIDSRGALSYYSPIHRFTRTTQSTICDATPPCTCDESPNSTITFVNDMNCTTFDVVINTCEHAVSSITLDFSGTDVTCLGSGAYIETCSGVFIQQINFNGNNPFTIPTYIPACSQGSACFRLCGLAGDCYNTILPVTWHTNHNDGSAQCNGVDDFQFNIIPHVAETEINDLSIFNLTAYPNPSIGDAHVDFTAGESGLFFAQFYALDGRLIETQAVQARQNDIISVNFTLPSDAGNGVYLCRIIAPHSTAEKMLTVLR